LRHASLPPLLVQQVFEKLLSQAAQKDLRGEPHETKWDVGVTEYWSSGVRTHHSTTPSLQYSNPYEAIEAWELSPFAFGVRT
jgi:hypothetical protein